MGETQIKPVTLRDAKEEPLTENIKTDIDIENEEKGDLLSAMFDSPDEQPDAAITSEAKSTPSEQLPNRPKVVLGFTESTKTVAPGTRREPRTAAQRGRTYPQTKPNECL